MHPLIQPDLLDRFSSKPKVRRRLIRMYLDSTPDSIATIGAALLRSDFEEVGWHAHALKGASSAMGAEQMAALCDQLQSAAKAGNATLMKTLNQSLQQCYGETKAVLTTMQNASPESAQRSATGQPVDDA